MELLELKLDWTKEQFNKILESVNLTCGLHCVDDSVVPFILVINKSIYDMNCSGFYVSFEQYNSVSRNTIVHNNVTKHSLPILKLALL